MMYDVSTWLADGRKILRRMTGAGIGPRCRSERCHRVRPADRGRLAIRSALSRNAAVPRFSPAGVSIQGQRGGTGPHQIPVGVSEEAATILVVDDEPRMRRLARRMLSELGYQVIEAENAAAAARVLDTDFTVDLLFTDVVMPGEIDGRALGHWARQTHPGLGVLLTSGFTQHNATTDVSGAEPMPLLSKPYSKEQLQKALQSLLGVQPP
jgi:CheY-like chemotaxis protein